MDPPTGVLTCAKCGETKDRFEFLDIVESSDLGFLTECRSCRAPTISVEALAPDPAPVPAAASTIFGLAGPYTGRRTCERCGQEHDGFQFLDFHGEGRYFLECRLCRAIRSYSDAPPPVVPPGTPAINEQLYGSLPGQSLLPLGPLPDDRFQESGQTRVAEQVRDENLRPSRPEDSPLLAEQSHSGPRRRGRPRLYRPPGELLHRTVRSRGRPRIYRPPSEPRPRGRPRTYRPPSEPRPRGRPRIHPRPDVARPSTPREGSSKEEPDNGGN
ncbi:uncharacterized protein GGS25DRAFT_282249 [Hypoxylon fragiforme]|uniref:uncharacterized protein n=1 Tax=Hypoxylon fragiforme TaxID=63214 RepID=UPI0020C729B5|nr:uncharacterized protein GGS25DRAFT_282249 [Hypoxylon fragiforme]KAI2608558.1 hypothetical protein GGS25DRAFT_282249 [Hypoxylon fragiforme]